MPRWCKARKVDGDGNASTVETWTVHATQRHPYELATGAGELAMPSKAGGIGVVPSALIALLSSLSFVSVEPVESLRTSSENAEPRGGAMYEGTCHTTPVKDRSFRPFFSHLLTLNLPVRSRARRLALIAPWFALGPTLGAGAAAASGVLLFGSLMTSPIFCFFVFGPGFPRGFGVPLVPLVPLELSAVARLRFLGAGPLRFPFAGGTNDEGVLGSFIAATGSAGVSVGDGAVIWGVGVLSGDELSFEL
jgi:hypothetical protein